MFRFAIIRQMILVQDINDLYQIDIARKHLMILPTDALVVVISYDSLCLMTSERALIPSSGVNDTS